MRTSFVLLAFCFTNCTDPCGVPTTANGVIFGAERCPAETTGPTPSCELPAGQPWGPCLADDACGSIDAPAFCLHSADGSVCVPACVDDCPDIVCDAVRLCDITGVCVALCEVDSDCPAAGMTCAADLGGVCSWPN